MAYRSQEATKMVNLEAAGGFACYLNFWFLFFSLLSDSCLR